MNVFRRIQCVDNPDYNAPEEEQLLIVVPYYRRVHDTKDLVLVWVIRLIRFSPNHPLPVCPRRDHGG